MCLVAFLCANARAQDSAPSPPPSAAAISAEQLAERLKAMEERNKKLAEELVKANKNHDEQMKLLLEKLKEVSDRIDKKDNSVKKAQDVVVPSPRASEGPIVSEPPLPGDALPNEPIPPPPDVRLPPTTPPVSESDTPVPDYTDGRFFPNFPAPGYPSPNVPGSRRLPLNGTFGPGFRLGTVDDQFRLQVNYESQIEGRAWGRTDQIPANSGIFLPRQRIFFSGNITKPIEYEFAINRGFGTFNLLNAYINVHLDDRLEVRFGRFFTPFDYDQYAISNYWLPTPERSVFTTNVGLNRQFGLMAWGYLFDKRLDYAAGIFNGSRNSFESQANAYDFVTYLNARPFQESDSLPALKFLNLGTSFAIGDQNQSAVPMSFRIAGASPTGDVPGPGTVPFLILNRDVVERGQRLLGSVHSAYFYKRLSLIGEWQYGYGNYASASHPSSSQVPFSGFYVSGGYFLTGEHVDRRARINPLRPFVPTNKGDRRGPGAWEVAGRVSELALGKEIFSGGFSDPNLWSNRATTTELGLNWYWNEYVKVYMFWLHGDFGSPVQYRPGGLQKSADMFWLRFQLYF